MEQSQLTPFAFGDNMVRVLRDENGDPWFVAKDVALALDYPQASVKQVVNLMRSVPEEWKGLKRIMTLGGEQNMLTVSEPGLYFFLGRSDKPRALPFQKWLAGEVLPAIRKTGSYSMPGRAPSRREPMPENLPPDALALRPAMRQRLWRDALDSARLEGGTAREWFAYLCRLVSALPPAPKPARDKVRDFFQQCCRAAPGCRIRAPQLYEAFRRWHAAHGGHMPSKKAFGLHMQEFARRLRSDGSIYLDIALK